MKFPLSFWDMGLWLAVNAIVLLMVSELFSSYHGKFFKIERKKLRIAAATLGILFMIFVGIEAFNVYITMQP